MAKQAKRQLAGSGEALPVGVIGESTGISTTTTTNTNRKYTATTTVAGINGATNTVLTQSFNKGVYWVSIRIVQQKSNTTTGAYCLINVKDGASFVYPSTGAYPLSSNIPSGYVVASFSFPLEIKNDSTSITVTASWNINETAGTDALNEITAARIA